MLKTSRPRQRTKNNVIQRFYVQTFTECGTLEFDLSLDTTVKMLKQILQRKFTWPPYEFLLKACFLSGEVLRFNGEEQIPLCFFKNARFTLEKYSTSADLLADIEYANSLLVKGLIRSQTKLQLIDDVPRRFIPWSPFNETVCMSLIEFIGFCRTYYRERTSADVKFVVPTEFVARLGGPEVARCLNNSFPNNKRIVLSYMAAGCGPVQLQSGKRFIEVPLNDKSDYEEGFALVIKHNLLYQCSERLPGTVSDIDESIYYGRTNITKGEYFSLYISVDQTDVNVHSSSKSIVYYCSEEMFNIFELNQN
jgi:hypothetical protein